LRHVSISILWLERARTQLGIPGHTPVSLDGTCTFWRFIFSGRFHFYLNPRAPVDTISCRRCKKNAPKLEKPPFRNETGERVHEEICQNCWADWLEHQTVLINHHGLDPRNPKAREFLYEQIETVLLKGEQGEQVDTSKRGTIDH